MSLKKKMPVMEGTRFRKKLGRSLIVTGVAIVSISIVAFALLVGYLGEDRTTNGANWQTEGYGDCAYILAAYNVPNVHVENEIIGGDSFGYDVTGGPLIEEFRPYSVYNLVSTQATGDARALWYPNSVNPGKARAACYFNDDTTGAGAPPNTFNVNISSVPEGDYRLSVYMVDWDTNDTRNQDVAVTSNGSSASTTISSFHDGVYQNFKVHVGPDQLIRLDVTQTQAEGNAVISGVFLDVLGESVTGVVIGDQDWDTQGNWEGNYGNAWYLLCAMSVPNRGVVYSPTNYSYNLTGGNLSGVTYLVNFLEGRYGLYAWTDDLIVSAGGIVVDVAYAYAWEKNVGDPRALLTTDPGAWTTNATCWDSEWNWASLLVYFTIPDYSTEMSIYAVDYDRNNRNQAYYIYDPTTFDPTTFDPTDPTGYLATATSGAIDDVGVYTTFSVVGPGEIALVVTPIGQSNAVISGIFFDNCIPNELPPPEPRTIGFWKHQVSGRGHPQVSEEEMWTYLSWIHDHSEIFDDVLALFEGVDYSVWDVLNAKKKATMFDRAKQQYMGLLLNVASGKLSYVYPVDFTGTEAEGLTTATTVGEAINEIETILLLSDSTRSDYEKAKTIADVINNGVATD